MMNISGKRRPASTTCVQVCTETQNEIRGSLDLLKLVLGKECNISQGSILQLYSHCDDEVDDGCPECDDGCFSKEWTCISNSCRCLSTHDS